jgi:hypothetical protein
MRKRVDGYCIVSLPDTAVHLRRDQYHSTRLAWIKGTKFVDIIGLHGERGTICLEGCEGIYDMAPENVMGMVEESRADSSDDSLAGSA